MFTVSRRLYVYWLLLLVPTLLVGIGAIQLLRREQARVAEREANASEARRAAVTARAGLIVESVESLVTDVNEGLLDTLAAMPADDLEVQLALWQKSNPLVHTAFRCRLDGQLISPVAGAGDEETRAFRRRFEPFLERERPWMKAVAATASAPPTGPLVPPPHAAPPAAPIKALEAAIEKKSPQETAWPEPGTQGSGPELPRGSPPAAAPAQPAAENRVPAGTSTDDTAAKRSNPLQAVIAPSAAPGDDGDQNSPSAASLSPQTSPASSSGSFARQQSSDEQRARDNASSNYNARQRSRQELLALSKNKATSSNAVGTSSSSARVANIAGLVGNSANDEARADSTEKSQSGNRAGTVASVAGGAAIREGALQFPTRSADSSRDRAAAPPPAGMPGADQLAAVDAIAAGRPAGPPQATAPAPAAATVAPFTIAGSADNTTATIGPAAAIVAKSEKDARTVAPAAEGKTADPFNEKVAKGFAPLLATPVSGWAPYVIDGHLHLVGWALTSASDTEVRGVDVEIVALAARLGGALPVEVDPGEGYILRDDQNRVIQHHAGSVSPAALRAPSASLAPAVSAVRLNLSPAILPGWWVQAYFDPPVPARAGEGGVIIAASLLLGLLVLAILAGGSLLLWQARQSEAEALQRTSFVANVSHEFKTPLTTIRLYAELLEQGRVAEETKRADYLRTIGRETQRLARLVGNALEFSRLEQGRKKYSRETIDLSAELARLVATHGTRLTEAGLKLDLVRPPGPLKISTDRDALEQILINLLDNAGKYAASGGEVTVELAARATGGAEVRVLDRGPGVPAEHRDRIFEKFHRVDNALTAEQAGTGLGLSIARQLARGLGGDLRFRPREGGGSAFLLELP